MAARPYAGFNPETVEFLTELSRNNDRDWFNSNKDRYEEWVLDPALRFIDSMQQPLAEIAPKFVAQATRVGGSLMRVYRDTRFSNDKTPYKTNIGIQFRHERAKDVHAPGYYVHIAPGEAFVGVGMWRPAAEPLRRIRERIAARPAEWKRVLSDAEFKERFRLGGDSLTRPPRGFDKTHECIDDIKRKSFIALADLSIDDCISPHYQCKVESAFRAGTPFMKFLCKAVNLPFEDKG